MKPYLLIRTNEGRYHQGQVSEDTDDRSNICLQPTFYQQLGVTLQNEVGPYMSHKAVIPAQAEVQDLNRAFNSKVYRCRRRPA